MLLAALYFFIPAYIANMAPVFVKKVNFLDKPIDAGKTWRGKRILGDNKTWRGLLSGVLAGFLIFELQRIIYKQGLLQNFALIDYAAAPIFLGVLLGFSALFGDIFESFFKRRLNIRPGRPWVPFDQLDFIIASIIITLPWSNIGIVDSLLVLLVIFFGTIAVQLLAYALKLKKDIL